MDVALELAQNYINAFTAGTELGRSAVSFNAAGGSRSEGHGRPFVLTVGAAQPEEDELQRPCKQFLNANKEASPRERFPKGSAYWSQTRASSH
jgi:hypothetical protein